MTVFQEDMFYIMIMTMDIFNKFVKIYIEYLLTMADYIIVNLINEV